MVMNTSRKSSTTSNDPYIHGGDPSNTEYQTRSILNNTNRNDEQSGAPNAMARFSAETTGAKKGFFSIIDEKMKRRL